MDSLKIFFFGVSLKKNFVALWPFRQLNIAFRWIRYLFFKLIFQISVNLKIKIWPLSLLRFHLYYGRTQLFYQITRNQKTQSYPFLICSFLVVKSGESLKKFFLNFLRNTVPCVNNFYNNNFAFRINFSLFLDLFLTFFFL